ncbi:MAG TPA: glucosaminidase domain-containing protein [Hyphomicrobium sp.]|nr:glucosaminidase domain-containing protein [Hyphomicrobium sp.]
MISRVGTCFASVLATAVSAVAISAPAIAAELPQIKISDRNSVPACVTPGRLTAFLESRNKNLAEKFSTIAADYARIGDELHIRWDTAFFQMLLETGNLTFTGDVSPKQNNFAGLGATGKKAPGESFPDVPTGVKAHLEHLLMYSGETIESPVAERTRKVQEWGVLTSWQKSISGPMTFTQLAKQWAPTSRGYSRDIENVSDAFYNGPCKSADPKPEMMALVKPAAAPEPEQQVASAEPAAETTAKVSGVELARRAADEARANGTYVRSNLGAGMLAAISTGEQSPDAGTDPAKTQPAVKILNAPEVTPPPAASAQQAATVQTAALGSGVKSAVTAAPPVAAQVPSKCKVWTASYGGSHAVIIKASADSQDNYTVLDVNEGTEQREADAYIAAYAKGGLKVGEFTNTTQALDKAFELCPEG